MFLTPDDGARYTTIHSFTQQIFVEHLYMSGTILGTWDKRDKESYSYGAYALAKGNRK